MEVYVWKAGERFGAEQHGRLQGEKFVLAYAFFMKGDLSSCMALILCWQSVFVDQAEDEYMMSDPDILFNKFISVPRDMGQFNCASFVAGITKGVLDGAGFPAR